MNTTNYIYDGEGFAWLDMEKPVEPDAYEYSHYEKRLYHSSHSFSSADEEYSHDWNLHDQWQEKMDVYNSRRPYVVHPDLKNSWIKGNKYQVGVDFIFRHNTHWTNDDVIMVPLASSPSIDVDKLFDNNFDCYSECDKDDNTSVSVPAMTKKKFKEIFNAALQTIKNDKP